MLGFGMNIFTVASSELDGRYPLETKIDIWGYSLLFSPEELLLVKPRERNKPASPREFFVIDSSLQLFEFSEKSWSWPLPNIIVPKKSVIRKLRQFRQLTWITCSTNLQGNTLAGSIKEFEIKTRAVSRADCTFAFWIRDEALIDDWDVDGVICCLKLSPKFLRKWADFKVSNNR